MEIFHDPNALCLSIVKAAKELDFQRVRTLMSVETDKGLCPLLQISRKTDPGFPRILLSAGIHGDEPAGPHAVLELLRSEIGNPGFSNLINLTSFPLINPSGFLNKTRTNREEIDLNREFAKGHPSPEIRCLMDVLRNRTFELSIEFHEDVDTKGFYLYEHFPDHKEPIGPEVISALEGSGFPILKDPVIEGMPAHNGIIHPRKMRRVKFRRHGWPEALYLYRHGTRRTFTLETPALIDFSSRVQMHVLAFRTIVSTVVKEHQSR